VRALLSRLLAAAAFCLAAAAAHAQSTALVVPACGPQTPPFAVGGLHVPLMDVNGNLCSAGGGGGTFTWPGTAPLTNYGTAPTGTVPAVNAASFAQAGTTGGATPALQNALTTPIVVKASAGQVYKVQCDNLAGATNAWVQLINASATPALGTAVLDQVALPVGGTGGFALPVGEAFATGISIGASTTPNGVTAVSTAVNCSVAFK
jgi:hypothetical protein